MKLTYFFYSLLFSQLLALNVFAQTKKITYPESLNRPGLSEVLKRTMSLNIYIIRDSLGMPSNIFVPYDSLFDNILPKPLVAPFRVFSQLKYNAAYAQGISFIDAQIDTLNAQLFDIGLQFKRAKITIVDNSKYYFWVNSEEATEPVGATVNEGFRSLYLEDSVLSIVITGPCFNRRTDVVRAVFAGAIPDTKFRTRPLLVMSRGNFADPNPNGVNPALARFLLQTLGSQSTQSQNELVNKSNCHTTGDFICDTPADFVGTSFQPPPPMGDCTYRGFLPNNPVYPVDANNMVYAPLFGNLLSVAQLPCVNNSPRSLTVGQLNRIVTLYYLRWKRFK